MMVLGLGGLCRVGTGLGVHAHWRPRLARLCPEPSNDAYCEGPVKSFCQGQQPRNIDWHTGCRARTARPGSCFSRASGPMSGLPFLLHWSHALTPKVRDRLCLSAC